MEKYYAIIIGFGKGGKTLAGKLAADGKRVALIEKSEKMYGGTCINVGCIPSKSLVHSGKIAEQNSNISFEEKSEWYRKAIEEKVRLTTMLRTINYNKLNQNENVKIYNGVASFLSPTQVQIKDKDNTTTIIEGEQIFIDTGSSARIPNIEGLKNNSDVYFSETLMNLEKLPRRLVIIGGGYIGLEFASMYANFGSEVIVLQDGEKFMPKEDEDLAEEVKKELEKKKIIFKLGVTVQKIIKREIGSTVSLLCKGKEEEIEADAILVAIGRKPNIEELNLSAAKVELTDRGAIKVDNYLKTTIPNIWAMGDVIGGLQFTYISLDDFRIIWSQLNGGTYNLEKRKNVPYSVFIDPSFSRVGLSEREAKEAGYPIKIAKLSVSAIPKAQVLKHPVGMLKAIIHADTNKILGAVLFCEESYEMINIIKLAIDINADYTVLREQIFTHPTMSEALNDLFAL